jgi:hypothetical protein
VWDGLNYGKKGDIIKYCPEAFGVKKFVNFVKIFRL